MILNAFAEYLHNCDQESPAQAVLGRWLWEKLSQPPQSAVDNVLHRELGMRLSRSGGSRKHWVDQAGCSFEFTPVTPTGRRLLGGLYRYAMAYEQQKWSRWVHRLKASDFNEPRVS